MAAQQPDVTSKTPYSDDKLRRRAIAEKLTNYVDRVKNGAVIAINASWGEGKTWFARNWQADLAQKGYPTIYLDAFDADYSDDPFISICAELAATAPKNTKTSFVEAAKRVGAAAIPLATKATLAAVGNKLVGEQASSEIKETVKKVWDGASSVAEKYVEKRINELTKAKEARALFKERLQAITNTSEKPLIFFIDELDRCRPNFAVQIIERIKHYFDVPNLVFILIMHRGELEEAIKGVYGNIDASGYLGKFIHLSVDLAPRKKVTDLSHENLQSFVSAELSKIKYPAPRIQDQFEQSLLTFSPIFSMSLRDIQRAALLFSVADQIDDGFLFGYLACLKLKQPATYEKLRSLDEEAHRACAKTLLPYMSDGNGVELIRYLHAMQATRFNPEGDMEYRSFFPEFLRRYPAQVCRPWFAGTFKSLDISLT